MYKTHLPSVKVSGAYFLKTEGLPSRFVVMRNDRNSTHIALSKNIDYQETIPKSSALCGRNCKRPTSDNVHFATVCKDCQKRLNRRMKNYFWNAKEEEFYHPIKDNDTNAN
jgi:hypothetical protein